MIADEQGVSLHEIIGILRKRWRQIVVPAMIVALTAGMVNQLMPRKYESYALIKIGYSSATNGQLEKIPSLNAIMRSPVVLEDIAKRAGVREYKLLKNAIVYGEVSDLLRITVHAETPQKAQTLAAVASEIVLERHAKIYKNAEERVQKAVKYVKETIRPVPLSSGMTDFLSEPTTIAIPALLIKEPLPTKTIMTSMSLFVPVLFLCSIIAFYREGSDKGQK